MTKDFMTLVDMGICDREHALRSYCSSPSVFFPPHPSYVIESTVKGFKLYWAGKIDADKLKEYCYLKDINGLYKYYDQFMEVDDNESI